MAPERHYRLDVGGIGLAIHEWGKEADQPLFLVHGGFDFSRTYEVFAPKLAGAGWRVVAWDQRGHGDSDHAPLYGWDADIRDAMAVMDAITQEPAPVVGHSKGGSLMIQLADAQPYRFSHLVNLDGLPSKRPIPDVAEHERTRMVAGEISGWLDHRRRTAGLARHPGTLEELARRRGRMNPRLPFEWLCHLVTVGARQDPDGWRWKIDASMRFGGFGPWRPEWTLTRLPGLGMPFLGMLGSELEEMGWGTLAHHVTPYIPADGPGRAARRRRSLRAHRATRCGGQDGARLPGGAVTITMLRHNKVDLALHRLAAGTGTALLLLHGLGEASPTLVPAWASAWPGAVYALDFTGHGRSTVPPGGGYTAEIILADADVALAELGTATLVGRGLGAYVALMLAGARPQHVRGAVLADGPGLAGGAIGPTSQSFVSLAPSVTHRIRTRCSSCRATCAHRTTPRCSCAWRWSRRVSTSRSP